jgi:hypothetical protein
MELSKRQIRQLQKIIETAQAILADASKRSRKSIASASVPAREARARRSGKELAAFRKAVRAERKRGVPVAEIAERHKVSTTYIYQL